MCITSININIIIVVITIFITTTTIIIVIIIVVVVVVVIELLLLILVETFDLTTSRTLSPTTTFWYDQILLTVVCKIVVGSNFVVALLFTARIAEDLENNITTQSYL